MNLKVQKTLAAKVLGISPKKVVFATDKLATIKEALTRADVRDLINNGTITVMQKNEQSRSRARVTARQKSRGLRGGAGSRKGTANARLPVKLQWMRRVRAQRAFVRDMKDRGTISHEAYRELYMKIKANAFKSKEAIKLFATEHNLFNKR